jgi:hypothetical protein
MRCEDFPQHGQLAAGAMAWAVIVSTRLLWLTAVISHPAIIFIRHVSDNFLPWNLTRNLPDFQGKVLYVHDLGDLNHLLMQQYPGRKFFVYEYDETKPAILRQLAPDEAVKTGS